MENEKEIRKALVILSGGQDSTTCLFLAKKWYDEVHAITFDYGQKHRIEIEAAKKVAELANVVTHTICNVPDILKSTSPLVSNTELEQYESYDQMEEVIGNRVELTFVPLRNPLFLLIAANHAIAMGAKVIVTGVCESDNANYPDCTSLFIRTMQSMLAVALGQRAIEIQTPLIHSDKQHICRMASGMHDCWDALAYTHTSYDGKYPPTDMNHANVLRARGFEEANLPDPLVLRAYKEGLMGLPNTHNYDEYR